MQDSDSSQLVNKLPPKPGLLLGVTNPFFEKSCVHWPHVLSLGRRMVSSPRQKSPTLGAPVGPPPGWKTKTHKRYISKDRELLKRLENALKGGDQARASFPFPSLLGFVTILHRNGGILSSPTALLFSIYTTHRPSRALS